MIKGYAFRIRQNYEAWSAGIWGIAILFTATASWASELPRTPFFMVLSAQAVMFGLRSFQAYRHHVQKKWVDQKSSVEFHNIEDLLQAAKGHNDSVWYGTGFYWTPEHTQKAFDLMNFASDLVDEEKGAAWIQGMDKSIDIRESTEANRLHRLLAGSTGSGKTVMLSNLIVQDIARTWGNENNPAAIMTAEFIAERADLKMADEDQLAEADDQSSSPMPVDTTGTRALPQKSGKTEIEEPETA
jgi:hypothetical protein